MKRQFLLYATIVAGMVASCSKEDIVEISTDKNASTITTIDAVIADTDAGTTKTVRKSDGKIYWNPGDEINVFFGTDKGKFTSLNTEDASTTSFNGSILISSVVGMNEGDDGNAFIWGLYPYNENASFDGTYVHTSLTNNQTGKAGSFADDLFITLAKEKGFLLSFYNVLSGIKFSVQKEGIKKITFSGNNGEILTGNLKLKFGNDSRPVVSEITNGKTSITLSPDGESFAVGEYYYIVFAPNTFSNGFSLTFTTDNQEGTYTYSNSISFPRNKFGTLTNADKDVSYYALPEYVDLGLPSGMLWATYNVGASVSEGEGNCFAWGYTASTKWPYYVDWSSYKYCNGSASTLIKYCNNSTYGYNGYCDNKMILDTADDIVHIEWGENWRMPTVGEWNELKDNQNCNWVNTQINGVYGTLVTSKKPGYTDRSIFLPNLRGHECLYYWSSSLNGSSPDKAWILYEETDNEDHNPGYYITDARRNSAFPIRPVYQPDNYISVTGITLDKTAVRLKSGANNSSIMLEAIVSPSNASNKYVLWTSSNNSVASVSNGYVTGLHSGTATITAYSDNGAYSANCTVTVIDEYVDLGLSVKWGTCNVGAKWPEEDGFFFAWGETSPKDSYDWSNYIYCNGNEQTLTKYCSEWSYGYKGYTDGKTVLDPEDDAAHVNWGGSWRMPTESEWNELINAGNCTWTSQTMNGVNGYKVTSKIPGYTDKSIFLPCSGWCFDNTYSNVCGGTYWTSTLYESVPDVAVFVTLGMGYIQEAVARRYGLPVRPVRP